MFLPPDLGLIFHNFLWLESAYDLLTFVIDWKMNNTVDNSESPYFNERFGSLLFNFVQYSYTIKYHESYVNTSA